MPYIKRIASIVNGADACGGGMKKQGLVYGSDWARVTRGSTNSDGKKVGHLAKKGPHNYKFTLPGQAIKTCCSTRVAAVVTYTRVRGRNMTMR
jgi:hypothetical protein